jgi:hypothetical protein
MSQIRSYIIMDVTGNGVTIIPVQLDEEISIPANATPLTSNIVLIPGRYCVYHDRDCRWFTAD